MGDELPRLTQEPTTMISLDRLAAWLALDPADVLGMTERGECPGPVVLAGRVRWSEGTLADWVAAGCPSAMPPTSEVFAQWRHAVALERGPSAERLAGLAAWGRHIAELYDDGLID